MKNLSTFNSLNPVETRSIIVHLPINVQSFQNYKKPQGNDSFNPASVDLDFKTTSFHIFDDNEIPMIVHKKDERFSVTNSAPMFHQYFQSSCTQNQCAIHCWHCVREINKNPIGIPVKLKNDEFVVRGIFCCFPCALVYNYQSPNNSHVIQQREALLRLMYHRMTKKNPEELTYAPIRESLKFFGGNLSHEQFHNHKFDEVNIVENPMTPIPTVIEEYFPSKTFVTA